MNFRLRRKKNVQIVTVNRSDWTMELYRWLLNTFKETGDGRWNYVGTEIYFYREDFLVLFLLKWSGKTCLKKIKSNQ